MRFSGIRIYALVMLLMLASAPLYASLSDFNCIIEPHAVVELGSPVKGIIDKIHVDRSDSVEKGQVLIELDADVERAIVAQALAKSRMKSDINLKKAQEDLAKRNHKRVSKLFKNGSVSSHDMDKATAELKVAVLELKKAHEQRRLNLYELKRVRAVLNQRIVRSTLTGVVVDRFKSPGESVDDEAILRLAQIDPLRVEVILPARVFGIIEPGIRVPVIPEYPGNVEYMAEVTMVDRLVDAASGTFNVRLKLPNPDYKIAGGLECRVRFDMGEQPRNSRSISHAVIPKRNNRGAPLEKSLCKRYNYC